MTSSLGKWGVEALEFLRDSVRNMHDERINEAFDEAIEIGIATTASALYEAGVEDDVIINLLQKHWQINEIVATEVLRYERTVEYPSRALGAYLSSQGIRTAEIRSFMIKNNVRKKLEIDTSLWKLPPEKLMDAVKG